MGNGKNENVKTNKIQHLNSLLISRFYDRSNGEIIMELSLILSEMRSKENFNFEQFL